MTVLDMASASRMTEAEYRLKRAELRAMYGDTAAERTGLCDQALASLFYRSGWTQEQLATEEGNTRSYITKRLLFGRFLANVPMGTLPKNLTERRFRGYWEHTTGTNERQRFAAVERLMQDELTLSKDRSPIAKKPIAEALIREFADGEWRRDTAIYARLDTFKKEDIDAVLKQMETRRTYHMFCEKRKGGAGYSYRLVHGKGHRIDTDIVVHELLPIVKALEVESKKHLAQYTMSTIKKLVHDLRTTLVHKLGQIPLSDDSDED